MILAGTNAVALTALPVVGLAGRRVVCVLWRVLVAVNTFAVHPVAKPVHQAALDVLLLRHGLKMVWANASPVTAQVVDLRAFGDWSALLLPHNPVGARLV